MNLTVRDITIDRDFNVKLPQQSIYNIPEITRNHEYIIVDSDGTLPVEEFTSLEKYNEILQSADQFYTEDELAVLSKTYLLSEMEEIIEAGSVQIYDFTAETQTMNEGNGASGDDEEIGRFLYEKGVNFLPLPVPDKLMDYISWEQNWYAAETAGIRTVRKDGHLYILI